MEALLDVVKVEVCPEYILRLEFENGEKRIFDMSSYMDKRPFVRLKDFPLFALAKASGASSQDSTSSMSCSWHLSISPSSSRLFVCVNRP